MDSPRQPLLIVEWGGTDAAQIPPRLRAGQLPGLAALVAAGRWQVLPASDQPWPWPHQFPSWRAAGESVRAIGWEPLAEAQSVAPSELDETPASFFPPAPDPSILRAHLAALYSVHNAAIDALTDTPPGILAVRYGLVADCASLYATSPLLSRALLAAHRVLDLLLQDLRAQVGQGHAVALTAPPLRHHEGFAAVMAARRNAAQLPQAPTIPLLAPALAQLAGIPPPGAGSDLPFDLTAKWLSPEIVPVQRWFSPPAIEPDANIVVRRGTTRDLLVTRTRFPTISWPLSASLWVAETGDSGILGALALTPRGRPRA